MCLESADRDERSRHVIDLVRASAPGAGPRRCDGTRGGDARAWPCWVGAWGGAEAGHVGHGWANLRGPWHRVLVERSQCATALPSPTAGISPGKPLPAVGRPLPAPTAAAGSKTGAQKGFLSAHKKNWPLGRYGIRSRVEFPKQKRSDKGGLDVCRSFGSILVRFWSTFKNFNISS